MTQEQKQLLLKDLCARLPYRTFVYLNPGAYNKPETCLLTGIHGEEVHLNVDSDPFRIDSIKPYLRPMLSMTEEEKEEQSKIVMQSISCSLDNSESATTMLNDWLLSKHFDVRGLISKGLALEAPEGMYKTE